MHKCLSSILIFILENKWITLFWGLSVAFIIVYLKLPKLIQDNVALNLTFQLAVGYIINFVFYITQVYIPNSRRNFMIRKCIAERIEQLIADMQESFSKLAHLYVKDHKGDTFSNEELKDLLKLNFEDRVNVLNASKTTVGNYVYFTVREWIAKCIQNTEKDIDNLFKYYASNISVNLMKILENILRSEYHSVMHVFLSSPSNINMSESDSEMFVEYYNLMLELKEIMQKEYLQKII